MSSKWGGQPDWLVPPSDLQLAVHTATKNGDDDELRPLLGQGLPPNGLWIDGFGKTALHWAIIYGHACVTRMLIEAGADVQVKSKYHPVSLCDWPSVVLLSSWCGGVPPKLAYC